MDSLSNLTEIPSLQPVKILSSAKNNHQQAEYFVKKL